jgi:putative membrane protein
MTPLDIVTQVSFEPVPTALIVITAVCYLLLVRRLGSKGRAWPVTRTICWMVGELVLAVGLLSGLSAHDDLFTVQAIQLILISMVAPLFFALSAPVTLALQVSSRRVQTVMLKVLDSRALKAFGHPITVWAVYGAAMFTLYFTGLYAESLENGTVHGLVHLGLILAGCLFWWPAIGLDPLPVRLNYAAKMFYLFVAMPFYTVLGLELQSQTKSITPVTSLAELQAGAGLLWVAGEVLGLFGVIVVFVQWLRHDERQAMGADRMNEAAAAAQLAHWRATREAAARAASPR